MYMGPETSRKVPSGEEISWPGNYWLSLVALPSSSFHATVVVVVVVVVVIIIIIIIIIIIDLVLLSLLLRMKYELVIMLPATIII